MKPTPKLHITFKKPDTEKLSDWLAYESLKKEFGADWDKECEELWEETKNETKEVSNGLDGQGNVAGEGDHHRRGDGRVHGVYAGVN